MIFLFLLLESNNLSLLSLTRNWKIKKINILKNQNYIIWLFLKLRNQSVFVAETYDIPPIFNIFFISILLLSTSLFPKKKKIIINWRSTKIMAEKQNENQNDFLTNTQCSPLSSVVICVRVKVTSSTVKKPCLLSYSIIMIIQITIWMYQRNYYSLHPSKSMLDIQNPHHDHRKPN